MRCLQRQQQQHRSRMSYSATTVGSTLLLRCSVAATTSHAALVTTRRALCHTSRPLMVKVKKDSAALVAVFDSLKFVNKDILPDDVLEAENVDEEVIASYRARLDASRFNRKDAEDRHVHLSKSEHRQAQMRWFRRYVLHISFAGRETVTTAARWAALEKTQQGGTKRAPPAAKVNWVTSEGKDLKVGPAYRKLLGNSGVEVSSEKTALGYQRLDFTNSVHLTPEERAYVEKHLVDRSGEKPHSVNAMPFSAPGNSSGAVQLEKQQTISPSTWSASDFVLDMEKKSKTGANRLAERFPLAAPLDGRTDASIRRILSEYCGDVSSPWPNEFSVDLTPYVNLLEFEFVSEDWNALRSGPTKSEPNQRVRHSSSRIKMTQKNRSDVVADITHLSAELQTANVVFKPLPLEKAKNSLAVLHGYVPPSKEDIASGVAVYILERLRDELGLFAAGGLGATVFISKLACNDCIRRLPKLPVNAGKGKAVQSQTGGRPLDKESVLKRAELLTPATVCNSPVWGNEAERIVKTRAKNCEEFVRTTIKEDSHKTDSVFLVDYHFLTSACAQQFMTVLPVCEIPLIGPSQVRLLEGVLGIRYLGDLTINAMNLIRVVFETPLLRILCMANTGGLHIPHEPYLGGGGGPEQVPARVYVGRIIPHSVFVATAIKMMRSLLLDLSSRDQHVTSFRVIINSGGVQIPNLNLRYRFEEPETDEGKVLQALYNIVMKKEIQLTRGINNRRLNIIICGCTPSNPFIQKRKMLERTSFLPYGAPQKQDPDNKKEDSAVKRRKRRTFIV